MSRIALVATGGTIASTQDERGAASAELSGAELVARLLPDPGLDVRVVEALNLNSYALTLADIDLIRRTVGSVLDDPQIAGVVVTHGTDTLEETALALDLALDDDRPVVLTGAQRDSDHPDSDGPDNLRAAVAVALDPGAAGRGVLVCFAGRVLAARGVRKVQTLDRVAFDADQGACGHVDDQGVHFDGPAGRSAPHIAGDLAASRVDIVALYPGADRTAVDALVAAGARGIVLEATGAGNATQPVLEAVREHAARGVAFIVSTRVPHGPIAALYAGAGGGVDLVDAGAVLAGRYRPGQARIALAALLSAGESRDEIAAFFATDPSPA